MFCILYSHWRSWTQYSTIENWILSKWDAIKSDSVMNPQNQNLNLFEIGKFDALKFYDSHCAVIISYMPRPRGQVTLLKFLKFKKHIST